MPASPGLAAGYPAPLHDGYIPPPRDEESAAEILDSVREQEAQFEQLTRELEEERKTVAHQLEKCRYGSETASMSSISSTDESFRWRPPPPQSSLMEDITETESRLSDAHLMDSCLRVLQERGIDMTGDDPLRPLGSEVGLAPQDPGEDMYSSRLSNGPTHSYDGSPSASLHSGGSLRTGGQRMVTTTTVTKTIHQIDSGHGSPRPGYGDHSPYGSLPDRGGQPHSPGGSARDPGTPTRLNAWQTSAAIYTGTPQDSFETRHYDDHSFSQYSPRGDPRSQGYDGDMVRPGPEPQSYRAPYGSSIDNPTYASMPPAGDEYRGSPRDYPHDADRYSDRPHQGSFRDMRGPPDSDPYGRLQGREDSYRSDDRYPPQRSPREDPYNRDETDFKRPDVVNNVPYGDINQAEPRFNGHLDDPGRSDSPYNYPSLGGDGRYPSDHQLGNRYPSNPQMDDHRPVLEEAIDPRFLDSTQQRLAPSPRPVYDDRGTPSQGPYDPDGYSGGPDPRRYDYGDGGSLPRGEFPPLGDPNDPMFRGSPGTDGRDNRWRNPELPEVIEFLSHPNPATKANAAAYLQHLCYMDDHTKAKTRALGGIPALVELVNNEIPEVHRNACGALKNLSYGRANDENKRAIKNASGIPALVRLLRKTPHNEIRENVTGILWNLSSCQDLKKSIIDEALTVLVNVVVIPHSGWDRNLSPQIGPRDVQWTVVFRNASGVLRNISSADHYARRKMRECEGLVDAILFIVRAAIGHNDIDNKCVENCVCLLRNLSYACQEVEDPQYLSRRQPKRPQSDKESTGCFGGSKKKRDPKLEKKQDQGPYIKPANAEPGRGMNLLWDPNIVHVYLPLLSDCTNSETLEAAAGAVQNLAACEWEPSVQIRSAVRKEKGLPIIVELLNLESDRVVRAAATALRNLALDTRNKELIGKYAMKQLAQKLPSESKPPEFPISDETVAAVEATLYEIVRKNMDFAKSLLEEDGVTRLVYITRARARFMPKVGQYASCLLYTMWQFKDLHIEYKKYGWREQHFVTRTMSARGGPRPNNTLERPHMDQSGHGTQNTLPPLNRANHTSPYQPSMNTADNLAYEGNYRMNDRNADRGNYRDPYDDRDGRLRGDEIPMNDLGPPPSHAQPYNPGLMGGGHSPPRDEYPPPPRDEYPPPPRDDYPRDDYPPVPKEDYRPPGGVPLFPNAPPASLQPQPQREPHDLREPIYSQVNKHSRRGQQASVRMDGPHPADAADSWV